MPKIIDDPRPGILRIARRRLLEQGYSQLSLRSVAEECSIAVGTIYNYFKSKDHLIACVMMEDWTQALDRMDQGCARAQTLPQGVGEIYRSLRQFAALYSGVWEQFSQAGGSPGEINSRHRMLRGQIAQRLEGLMDRLHKEDRALSPLLAEAVLAAALQPDIPPQQVETLAQRLR